MPTRSYARLTEKDDQNLLVMEPYMNFQKIVTLLRHNTNTTDWHVVYQTKKETMGYCLEDVNLRLILLTVQGKTIEIQILYAATIVFSFVLPKPARSARQENFITALERAISKVSEFHPGT